MAGMYEPLTVGCVCNCDFLLHDLPVAEEEEMILDRQSELYLQTRWHRGQLYVLSPNKVVDMLIDKANRNDRIWAQIERWLSAPARILSGKKL
ncbi:MAG: hypothetical protein JWQ87_5408 [Candidatus Sulfotelmatobacter sp.]|nr:hypothetical protein [Candidatus Sulfotelmatobacter sp.]